MKLFVKLDKVTSATLNNLNWSTISQAGGLKNSKIARGSKKKSSLSKIGSFFLKILFYFFKVYG